MRKQINFASQIYGKGFGGGHIIRVRYLGLSMDYSTPQNIFPPLPWLIRSGRKSIPLERLLKSIM